jgi:hypothetical protein
MTTVLEHASTPPVEGQLEERRRLAVPGWGRDLGVLVLHTGLVLWLIHRTLAHFATNLIGTYGDSGQFAWGITYTSWSLSHLSSPLLASVVEAPHGVNLMWNTSTPLLGVLGAPITLAAGPVVGYNLVLLTVLVANGFGCYLALRRFVAARLPRAAASLFFGFSPYLIPHASGHLNLTSVFLVPLLLVLMHEMLIERRWSNIKLGVLLGVTMSAQLLMTEELLATEALAVLVGVLILVAMFPRRSLAALRDGLTPRILTSSAIATGIFLVAAIYPLYVQFFGPQRLERGLHYKTDDFVTDLAQLWSPTPDQWSSRFWGPIPAFTGGRGEWNAYVGIPLLVLTVATAIWLWRRRPVVRWAALFAVIMLVLSFGPSLHINGQSTGIPMPWRVVQEIWILGSLIPSRLALYSDLAVALIIAVGLWEFARSSRTRAVVAVGLVVPVVISVWPAALGTAPSPTPAFFTSSAMAEEIPENSLVMLLPLSAEGTGSPNDAAALVWHAQARFYFRMTGGYWLNPGPTGSPQVGPTRTQFMQQVLNLQNGLPVTQTDEERTVALAELRAQGVERIVLGPMQHFDPMMRFLTHMLGQPDTERDGVHIWRLDTGTP